MTVKLPKEVLKELDDLVLLLAKGAAEDRSKAMSRLVSYEQSGKIPFSAMLELASEENINLAMYGIGALGRSKSREGAKKLVELFGKLKDGDPLFLEVLVDAMGESGRVEVLPSLLSLLGFESSWKMKLPKWMPGARKPEDDPFARKRMEFLLLPVMRAIENIPDAKMAHGLTGFLEHQDSLVRWHAVRIMEKNGITDSKPQLLAIAENDPVETVREAARLALDSLAGPLPNHLNN